MKKLKVCGMFFTFIALFTACDEVQTIKIPLNEITLDVVLELDQPTNQTMLRLTANETDNSFSGIFEGLSLSSDFFGDIKRYVDANEQIKFVLKKVQLLVTPTGDLEYKIQNFTSTATVVGSNETYTLPARNLILNEAVIDDAELLIYMNQILAAVQDGKTVNITVLGNIDQAELNAVQIGIVQFILDLVAEIKLSGLL